MKGYYFITDSKLSCAGNFNDVSVAVACGVGVVQYRNKNAETREMYEEAVQLREICSDAVFLINDRVDIALAAHADGVHLGQSDMPCQVARKLLGPEKIIGITVHNLNEASTCREHRRGLSGSLADLPDGDKTRCRKAGRHLPD